VKGEGGHESIWWEKEKKSERSILIIKEKTF